MAEPRRIGGDERRVVAVLTALFVLLGMAFAVLLPMFANFDEQTHLDRARYTSHHALESVGPSLRVTYGSWAAVGQVRQGAPDVGRQGVSQRGAYRAFPEYPKGDEGDPNPCPGVCQNIQYAHPPAWYELAAPFTWLVGSQPFPRTVLILRLLDVLLAAPLVALAWSTAREVWPRSRRRPLAVAGAVALMGPLAYTASGVNNDGLLLLAMGVAIAAAARLLRRGPSVPRGLVLGIAVGVGLLTKVDMVLAAPALGLCVLAAPGSWRDRIRAAVAFAVPALPGAIWWVHDMVGGGPLTPKTSELLAPPAPGPWSGASYPVYAAKKLPTLIARFWGTYSEPVSFLSTPVRYGLSALAVFLVVLWLICRRWSRPRLPDLRWWLLAAVPGCLVLGTLYASYDAYIRNGELRGLTPRYVYPSAAVLAVGAVAALAAVAHRIVPRRHHRGLVPAGLLVMAVSAVASVAKAIQNSYGTASWSDIRHRAPAVSPIGRPTPVVAIVAALWVVGLVLVLTWLWRSDLASADAEVPALGPADADEVRSSSP